MVLMVQWRLKNRKEERKEAGEMKKVESIRKGKERFCN